MAAYLIGEITVTDPVGYEEYRQLAPATVAQYGGQYLSRPGTVQHLEGGWTPERFVLLQFESVEALTMWWESPEYRPLRELRERSARSHIILSDGV
jgi:uncharacterized protein (DUF1330 family)